MTKPSWLPLSFVRTNFALPVKSNFAFVNLMEMKSNFPASRHFHKFNGVT